MGMPMELQTVIVTKGKEQRVQGNVFVLKKKATACIRLTCRLKCAGRCKAKRAASRS